MKYPTPDIFPRYSSLKDFIKKRNYSEYSEYFVYKNIYMSSYFITEIYA